MKNILYVDACVHRDTSRTEKLAQALLDRLQGPDAQIESVVLECERLVPLDGILLDGRSRGTETGDFTAPVFEYARQFARADEVVFAAPYWDFSFPAMLKIYLELLCAQGVTFLYSDEGIPSGLCRAKRAFYVTTAGGYIGQWDYGYEQVKALCSLYFGIEDTRCFRAEGLDIVTNDPDAIMIDALRAIGDAKL